MKKNEYIAARDIAAKMISNAGIRISNEEALSIEVADFGLHDLKNEGAQILTLVQTERISVKVLALFPGQTEPEHWHPQVGDDPGKEETIRVVSGTLFLYKPGPDTMHMGVFPAGKGKVYTCRNELVMIPEDQVTFKPGVKHWFKAGPSGAVLYSFSTIARDVLDKFTDPDVIRKSVIED